MGFLTFIRDAGKHITVNYMMSKDSVRKRLDGETGMSFTEFSYQLVQGYDFYWLYTHKNCKLQMGGSDQWGNITTGTELIRRKAYGEAFAFTCPLITKSDGGKFGKTEKGNIWLNKEKTSAYQFYQFWLNASDSDAEKWIKIFTFLDKNEIDNLVKTGRSNPSERPIQKRLAKEVTVFVHGEEEYRQALVTTEKLFVQANSSAESLTVEDLESIEGVVQSDYPSDKLVTGLDIVSFLSEAHIFPSKGEARRMVESGGISINRKKIEDARMVIESGLLLHGKYLLVQKGKKNYYLVKAV
jgi:tyrosyl-tRNA synthetase